MGRWFYHPLGDYAKNYVEGTATWSQRPHTRELESGNNPHGFNKIDWGPPNIPVYSMTNGTVQNAGWFGNDGVSLYGVSVRCTDNGYSEMMAKINGASVEDYPVFFNYIEMAEPPLVKTGDVITAGTQIGITNDKYSGSALHIDISVYNRYAPAGGATDKVLPSAINKTQALAITLDRYDAYGDKGENFDIRDFLSEDFSIDSKGNLLDTTNNPYVILGDDGLYYPPNSSGGIVKYQYNEAQLPIPGEPSGEYPVRCPINRFYYYAIAMQTPVYKEATWRGDIVHNYDSNVDINKYISYTEEEKQIALGILAYEAGGKNASNAVLEAWGRVLRNRIAQGYGTNLATTTLTWLGEADRPVYLREEALRYYKTVFLKMSSEQQSFLWGIVCGNNYGYIEQEVLGNNQWGIKDGNTTKYSTEQYLYNFNMLGANKWWPEGYYCAVAYLNGVNGAISLRYASDVNKKDIMFTMPRGEINGI